MRIHTEYLLTRLTMKINDLLSLNAFPKGYEACFLEECLVKESCLHNLYYKLQPVTNTWGDAIYPSALKAENLMEGCCRMYQAKKFVTCYAGFTHFFDEVRREDLPSFRNEIYSYFRGRSNFYRYSNAESGYFYTQSMADDVKALFMEYGYSEPKYERTSKAIVF